MRPKFLFSITARTDSLAACVIGDFHFWPSQEIDERLITTLGHMLSVRPGQVVSSISRVKLWSFKNEPKLLKIMLPTEFGWKWDCLAGQ